MAESADLSRSVFGASDEVHEPYCDPCNKDGNFVSVEGFCVNCSEYLCKQCFNSHRKFKALENHVLQDKDSMPDSAKSNRDILDACVEKCSIHPGKVVDFFCGTCEILGCYACVTVNHRQCEKVAHIPDVVKELETSVEFTEFDKILETINKKLNENKDKIAYYTEMNIQMKKQAKEELKNQRNAINKFFDNLENKIDLQIDHIQMDNNAVLKTASERLKSIEEEFNGMKTNIDSKKNGQNCQLFIDMKKSMQKIETINRNFNKLFDEKRIQKYILLPSEQIESMMGTTTEICKMATARFQAKIDISTIKDNNIPNIYGLTTVHGHYCVVTDNGNKCVKVVDTMSKCVTSEICIEATYLYGLTTVKNDWVAVSLFTPEMKNRIQFLYVSISGVITSTAKQFDVKLPCSDLEYCNCKLFLSQGNQIHVCNNTGQEIKSIKHDSAGVCLSQDGKTIYVTDQYKNTVTSMTLDGNVMAVYKDNALKYPTDITVDREGYVYVCSTDTRSIHQLTADLSKVQIIIEDASGGAITFSSTLNKLCLSDGKCVSVYDLTI